MDNERELVESFAGALNTKLLYFLPQDNVVQRTELRRQTILQYGPDCAQADQYRALAKAIEENQRFSVPAPLDGNAHSRAAEIVKRPETEVPGRCVSGPLPGAVRVAAPGAACPAVLHRPQCGDVLPGHAVRAAGECGDFLAGDVGHRRSFP